MALTHAQAGHFLHPLVWASAADDSYGLVATWTGSAFTTPSVQLLSSYHITEKAWFSVASVHPGETPGVGGLFKAAQMALATPITWWGFTYTESGGSYTQSFGSLGTSSIGGAFGAPPALGASGKLEFVAQPGGGYALMVAGTTHCLTAGASASSYVSTGAPTIRAWASALNQIWMPTPGDAFMGFFDMRPMSAPGALAITTPSDSTSSGVALVLSSPRPEASSQVYELIEPGTTDTGSSADRHMWITEGRSRSLGWRYGYEGTETIPGTSDVVNRIGQLRRSAGGANITTIPASASDTWIAGRSTYSARWIKASNQYVDTRGADRMSCSGGVWIGPADNSSGDQQWLPIPRNLLDTSYPTPSALRMRVEDRTSGQEFMSDGLAELVPEHQYRLHPQFDMPGLWETMQSTMEGRWKLPSGEWSEWTDIELPSDASSIFLYSTQAAPDWGIAWVPDTFAAAAADGFETGFFQTTPFQAGVVDSATFPYETGDCPEFQARIKIRAFGYGLMGEPRAGRAASITMTFAQQSDLTLTGSPIVGRQGLELPYAISHYSSPMSVHFDSITIGSVEAIRDYDAALSAASGTLVIPWTAFRDLSASWTRATGSPSVVINCTTRTIYASHDITLTSTLAADTSATLVSGTLLTHDMYATIGTTSTPSQAFCVVETETDQHVVEMPTTSTLGIITPPALDVSGILDGEQQTTAKALLLSDVVGGYEASDYDVPRASRGITTLMFRRGGDVVIVPIEGNINSSYAYSRDYVAARSVGGKAFMVGSTGGYAPELELSGTLYRGQLASRDQTAATGVRIASTIQDVCRIPHDADCILRDAAGTCHVVRVVGVSVPRSVRDQAEITISMVEVVV